MFVFFTCKTMLPLLRTTVCPFSVRLLAAKSLLKSQINTLVLSCTLSKESKDEYIKQHPKGKDGDEEASSKPQILVLSHTNNRIGMMTFEEAQTMAKQKDLKLVQIEDPSRTKRFRYDVYKLLTSVELHKERLKAKLEKNGGEMNLSKGEKMLIVGGKITEHDMKTRTKTIRRWLSKGVVIRVTINADRTTVHNLDHIYSEMEKAAAEVGGQALQKRRHGEEGHSLKFTLQMSRKKLDEMKNMQEKEEKTTTTEK